MDPRARRAENLIMTTLKVLLSFLFLTYLAPAQEAKTIPFDLHRHLELTICDPSGNCETHRMSSEAVHFDLEKFSGKGKGWDGWDRTRNEVNGITFKTEIHVIKHLNAGKYQYYIYAMIRSSTREGKLLRWNLKDLSELKERALEDAIIKFNGGTMQAKLVISPVDETSN